MKRVIGTVFGVVFVMACAGFVGGCKKGANASGGHAVTGLGKPLAQGQAFDLRLSPNGEWATYLREAAKPAMDGIPPQMLLGELHLTKTSGGVAQKLGTRVTNVPGGWLLSPDSKWVLFVADFKPSEHSGALHIAGLGEETKPSKLGDAVSYMLVSPDSKTLAFVDGGILKVGALPSGPFRDVSGEVASAAFSSDGQWLAYKRRLAAAGGLLLLHLTDEKATPRKLGDQSGDYRFSPDGAQLAFTLRSASRHDVSELHVAEVASGKTLRVANSASAFDFSPDSRWLARVEDTPPDQPGKLVVGTAGGSAGRKLGDKVMRFEFAPNSSAIAFLDRFDKEAGRLGAGVMTVAMLPDGEPQQILGRVPSFTWSHDGKKLAFLGRFLKPVYTVDLMVYTLGEKEPVKVHPGVFGYGFTPKNDRLLFRTNCIREGRACDLFSMDLSNLKEPPKQLLQGIFSFKFCSDDGERLLLSYAQTQADAYDVAVYNLKQGKHQTVDRVVALPALCAKADGSSIAYVVKDRNRPGVYVASDGIP